MSYTDRPTRLAPHGPVEPVAVIGASCRLPGGVDSAAALWAVLRAGTDLVAQAPDGRWSPGERAAAQGESSHPVVWRGGFLNQDINAFDAESFGIGGQEAELLDPQHRLLLEVSWEACEQAGLPRASLSGTRAGAFVGLSNTDHAAYCHWLPAGGGPYFMTGATFGCAAGRLSHALGLRGPSIALDTGCSSGLVAAHLACQSLQLGECDLAFAGAVNVLLSPRTFAAYNELGVLSPTGRCASFDTGADGYVRAEGCVVLVLKRLADAVRDRDRVMAVLAGTAVNHDGRSSRFTVPSVTAQEEVCRTALARADADPAAVGLIEAHGSGTPKGDRIEFTSLAAVYGQGHGRCAVGSVKSNLGHTEPAAGLVGLLKAVLAVQHGEVPASLHFRDWQSGIDPSGTRLYVPIRHQPWPVPEPPRLAAVCSYGVAGTNAHAIVAQPPAPAGHCRTMSQDADAVRVFLLSAASPAALETTSARLADWLAGPGCTTPLPDVAHTLALRRSHADQRLAVIARTREELISRLRAHCAGRTGPGVVADFVRDTGGRGLVWVFSGHGSQWCGMARELLGQDPVFTETVARLDPLITAESGFSPYEWLRTGAKAVRVDRVQPLIFTVQIALARTLRAHGVEPAAVVGHSMGEVAAAVAAGALGLADGGRVICRRSKLCLPQATAGTGAMAVVELEYERVRADLEETAADADVAVVAAPRSTVVAGAAADVRRLVGMWQDRGIPARTLAVDFASHSRLARSAAKDLHDALRDLRPGTPDIPFYTTVLASPRDEPACDAAYWAANLKRPVQAVAATAALVEDGYRVFQEISPHPVAVRPLADTLDALGAGDAVALPSLRSREDGVERLWCTLAALHCVGLPLPWERWYGDAELADVPTTAWDRRTYAAGLATVGPPAAEPFGLTADGDGGARTPPDGREAVAGPAGAERDLPAELRLAPSAAARRALLEERVAAELWALLRLRNRRIHPASAFCDLGLDSLLAVELRIRLERALRTAIPLDLIWKHPTLGELSARLSRELFPGNEEGTA